jgi:hypothetical protein
MLRLLGRRSVGIVLPLLMNAPVSALPSKVPFELAGDTIHWTMTIAPAADCIQDLRWSYMQIYDVSVVHAPKNGKIVMVGIGFRYFADPGFKGPDSFTLPVTGMNKKDPGRSYVQIEVTPRQIVQVSSAK